MHHIAVILVSSCYFGKVNEQRQDDLSMH